ncbi:hypothetical protein N7481_003147 [Penicillium waksmanii]|uniref:uncharacterized protein n=1 Tax=Penicillium waksmanii TaxID=69791 RepID=UPI00254668C3|nr:uncharacterized protein N7481_003147 [Penicillium waksmanii]KAJ5987937.1 hypothetical protein N7481_003147 [Penicillium waksmanii]
MRAPQFRLYSDDIVMYKNDVMAFTTYNIRSSITLCPCIFSYTRRKDILGAKTITANTNIAVAVSSLSIFLHELMYIVSEGTYGPVLTGKLAQFEGTKSATNANSYVWFAVAMYLNSNDWSRVIINRKRVSGPATRRSALVTDSNGGKAGNKTIDTNRMEMGEDENSDFP